MTRITFIKFVYWIAAAVDAVVAFGMVFPRLLQPALQERMKQALAHWVPAFGADPASGAIRPS